MNTQGRECPGQGPGLWGSLEGGGGGYPATGPRERERFRGMPRPVWELVGMRCLGNFQGKVFRRSQDPRSEA